MASISTHLRLATVASACVFLRAYDCKAELWNWEALWTSEWKEWCCKHEQKGCPSTTTVTTSTATQTFTSTSTETQTTTTTIDSCLTDCVFEGNNATCGARIRWASKHLKQSEANPCEAAQSMVAEQCAEVCTGCSAWKAQCEGATPPPTPSPTLAPTPSPTTAAPTTAAPPTVFRRPKASPTPTPAPSQAPPRVYPVVACELPGSGCTLQQVGECIGRARFGKDDKWTAWKQMNGQVYCSSRTFFNEDPAPYSPKECQCDHQVPTTTTTIAPSTTTKDLQAEIEEEMAKLSAGEAKKQTSAATSATTAKSTTEAPSASSTPEPTTPPSTTATPTAALSTAAPTTAPSTTKATAAPSTTKATAAPSTTEATTTPDVPPCDRQCVLQGESATCADRMRWMAKNQYQKEKDPCWAAQIGMNTQCVEVCDECVPEAAGCSAETTLEVLVKAEAQQVHTSVSGFASLGTVLGGLALPTVLVAGFTAVRRHRRGGAARIAYMQALPEGEGRYDEEFLEAMVEA